MATRPDRKTLLRRFIAEVWNDGNVEASDRYLAARYTVRHDPGDPWHGRELSLDEFKERLIVSRASFPDQRFELQELFEDGDAVVITWLWSGTQRGDLPGFRATQRVIHMSGATVYYFDADDRITGHWQIVDRLGVFQQLSQGPRPSAGPRD